jgi:hypothetical protein
VRSANGDAAASAAASAAAFAAACMQELRSISAMMTEQRK